MLSQSIRTIAFGAAMLALGALLSPGLAAVRAQPLDQTDCAAAQAPAVPDPATPATGTLAHVGDRVEAGGTALTVNRARTTDTVSVIQKAKPGRTFLVLDVTIENTGSSKASYNPFYFRLKDGDGYEYTAGMGADQSLKSGDLAPGEKVRGTITFDLPSSAGSLVVSYGSGLLAGRDALRVAID